MKLPDCWKQKWPEYEWVAKNSFCQIFPNRRIVWTITNSEQPKGAK